MLTKVVIGKKSDAHDSKESPRFASRLKKGEDLTKMRGNFTEKRRGQTL